MEEEAPVTPPEKPSRIPSWAMLGFVLALPRRASKPQAEEPVQAVPLAAPLAPPRLTTIEAVFAAWGKYAVWDGDLTQVALWSAETKNFSDCFEVFRAGDALYFRSIPRLTHPVLTHGVTGDSPLQYTETEAQRQQWLGARMDENWRIMTRPGAPALAPPKG